MKSTSVANMACGLWLLTAPLAQAIWNPIISGWNPDAAILRHGKDYYIACSSFEYTPGLPIYHSTDLSNWILFSHAATRPEQLQLYGTPTTAGKYPQSAWAPSLSRFKGKFWLAAMTRWTYDPVAKVWPRVWFMSSTDMINWSDPVWAEPWGIDPELFNDPVTGKTYLNLMAPNNNKDRLWGMSGCEVSLTSGKCIGPYVSTWNGTLPQTSNSRPEGPKTVYRDGYYYLIAAEGGTDELHRTTVARSKSPLGPYEAGPNNPLLFNGQWGFKNLTVQSTGHATLVETTNGEWYASYLARRNINGSSPLGRESFLTKVEWVDGWPVMNNGGPVLLSEQVAPASDGPRPVPSPWVDDFSSSKLHPEWYQLRTQYTETYKIFNGRLVFRPNVFSLSERDTPSAILRKQKSLNMTFSAELLGFNGSLGPRNRVGISAYLSEHQHQDIGLRGCVNATGMCLYTETRRNTTIDVSLGDHPPVDRIFEVDRGLQYWQTPLNSTGKLEAGLSLHIRATPLTYQLGYSFKNQEEPTYVAEIESRWQAFGPPGWLVFSGNSFALFATGEGEPWPFDAPDVGFNEVTETYFEENIPDYDRW